MMKKMPVRLWILIWLWIGIAAALHAMEPGYKGFARGDVLITVEELRNLMDAQRAWDLAVAEGQSPSGQNPKLVIVAVAKPWAQYRWQGHIPGALNIWRPDYESPKKLFGVRGENLMSQEDFQAFLRSLGIDKGSKVVWYDHKYDATRLWWACKLYGLETRVLDGGIKAWKNAGYEINRLSSADRPGDGTVTLANWGHPYLKVGREAVWRCKDDPRWVLWDIRSEDEWTGKRKRVRRQGHIPWQKGKWHSWKDVHGDDGSFLTADELHGYIARIGIRPTDHNVFYCQSGVRVTQTLFALYLDGWPLEHLHIFDSSMIGWGNSPDLPVLDGEGNPVPAEKAGVEG